MSCHRETSNGYFDRPGLPGAEPQTTSTCCLTASPVRLSVIVPSASINVGPDVKPSPTCFASRRLRGHRRALVSDCLGRQAGCHGFLSRKIALRIVRSFLATATHERASEAELAYRLDADLDQNLLPNMKVLRALFMPALGVIPGNDARHCLSARSPRNHLRDECRELPLTRGPRKKARARSPTIPRDNQSTILIDAPRQSTKPLRQPRPAAIINSWRLQISILIVVSRSSHPDCRGDKVTFTPSRPIKIKRTVAGYRIEDGSKRLLAYIYCREQQPVAIGRPSSVSAIDFDEGKALAELFARALDGKE